MIRSRRAKIVATVGPASAAPEMPRTLFEKDVDTSRLIFSPDEHATHAEVIDSIRALDAETGMPISILQDLQGPKIRLDELHGGARAVTRGDTVRFRPDATKGEVTIPLPHPEIFAAIQPGHRLFIDDGRVRLSVTSCGPS